MRHYVGYHKTAKMGKKLGWRPGQKEFKFWSRLSKGYLTQLEGNRVWGIEGTLEGRKTIYRLCGYYTVKAIRDLGYGDFQVFGTKGIAFETPIELIGYDWLRVRETFYCFSIGMSEIKNQDAITGLIQIAARPPKRTQADLEKKSSRNALEKQISRAKKLQALPATKVQSSAVYTFAEALHITGVSRATLMRRIRDGTIKPLPRPAMLLRNHRLSFPCAEIDTFAAERMRERQ